MLLGLALEQIEQDILETLAAVSCFLRRRKAKRDHAVTSSCADLDRCWGSSVAGESFHPHGGFHQINLERSGSHSRCAVAAEYLWAVAVPDQYSHRQDVIASDVVADELRKPEPVNPCLMTACEPE